MSVMASQITVVSIVCSTVCSGADQRSHQRSSSLAFVRGTTGDQWIPLTTRKIFPFDDVIMVDIGLFSLHIHRQLLSTCNFQLKKWRLIFCLVMYTRMHFHVVSCRDKPFRYIESPINMRDKHNSRAYACHTSSRYVTYFQLRNYLNQCTYAIPYYTAQ